VNVDLFGSSALFAKKRVSQQHLPFAEVARWLARLDAPGHSATKGSEKSLRFRWRECVLKVPIAAALFFLPFANERSNIGPPHPVQIAAEIMIKEICQRAM